MQRGDRNLHVFCVRAEDDLLSGSVSIGLVSVWAGVSVTIDIDLTFVTVVEIDLISVEGVELDLISVEGVEIGLVSVYG